jgi:hypothetical protein
MAATPAPDEHPEYRVIYENDITADSPRKAAERAYEIMLDPASFPPILTVRSPDGTTQDIDLSGDPDE